MVRFVACLLTALAAPGFAFGQGSTLPRPEDPHAVVPGLSPFTSLVEHRTLGDALLRTWRESNEGVGRLGGHAGHLQGRPPATAPAPSTPPPSAPPAGDRGTAGSRPGHTH